MTSAPSKRRGPSTGNNLADVPEDIASLNTEIDDLFSQEINQGRSYSKSVSISRTFKWGLGRDSHLDDPDVNADSVNSVCFLKRRGFWRIFIPLLVTAIFSTAGALVLVYQPAIVIQDFEQWRLYFFIAGIPILCWIGDFLSYMVVWLTDLEAFKAVNKTGYYYAHAVRRPLKHCLRSAMAMGWWAIVTTVINAEERSDAEQDATTLIMRAMGCITLYTFGLVVKKWLARSISSKFNRETHLQKMHTQFEKEYMLQSLLQPRGDLFSSEDEEEEDDDSASRLPFARSMSNAWRKRMGLGSKKEPTESPPVSPRSFNVTTFPEPNSRPSSRSASGELPLQISIISNELPTTFTPTGPRPSDSPRDFAATKSSDTNGMKRSGRKKMTTSSRRNKYGSDSAGSMFSTFRTSGKEQTALSGVEAAKARRISAGNTEKSSVDVNKMVKLEQCLFRSALRVTYASQLGRKCRTESIESDADANRLALYLFWNVKSNFDKAEITKDDLRVFFKNNSERTAAFEMLDDNKDGIITADDVSVAVQKIWVERTNLTASLHDTKAIVARLEGLIGSLINFVFCFAYLFIFQIDIKSLYTAISALILGFSFIFSNSVRRLYENVVFLFVVHPFDIGDVLEVQNTRYIVEEISLNFTCFKAGNNRRWFYPNHVLSNTPFINVTHSGNKEEYIRVLIDFDTPPTLLDEMRAALAEMEKNNRMEFAETFCSFRESANPMKMTLYVGFAMSHPGTSIGRCNAARTKVFVCISQVLQKMNVKYTWPAFRSEGGGGDGAGGGGGGGLERDARAVNMQVNNDPNMKSWTS